MCESTLKSVCVCVCLCVSVCVHTTTQWPVLVPAQPIDSSVRPYKTVTTQSVTLAAASLTDSLGCVCVSVCVSQWYRVQYAVTHTDTHTHTGICVSKCALKSRGGVCEFLSLCWWCWSVSSTSFTVAAHQRGLVLLALCICHHELHTHTETHTLKHIETLGCTVRRLKEGWVRLKELAFHVWMHIEWARAWSVHPIHYTHTLCVLLGDGMCV